ncbi:hypothetical protein EDD85DRAFT_139473 [Armillaria nabsnona]|nr:hypothetical protein EDD85DRAFT_139473 [Armillaria nabsnona]
MQNCHTRGFSAAVQVLTKQRWRQGGAGRHRDLATSPSQRKLMAAEERTKVLQAITKSVLLIRGKAIYEYLAVKISSGYMSSLAGFVAAFFIQTPMPRHAAYMQREIHRNIPTIHSNIVTSIFQDHISLIGVGSDNQEDDKPIRRQRSTGNVKMRHDRGPHGDK